MTRSTIRGLALLALVGLGLSACDVALDADANVYRCRGDEECAAPFRCLPSGISADVMTCQRPDTTPPPDVSDTRDMTTPPDTRVDTTDADATPLCESAEECAAGEGCSPEGVCGVCQNARDCRDGQACRLGDCTVCVASTDCDGELCAGSVCVACIEGDEDALCEAEYAPGYRCTAAGVCAPEACDSGADCALIGGVCEVPDCVPCVQTADCLEAGRGDYPPGTSCVDGICRQGACGGDVDCTPDLPICGGDASCRSCQLHSECLAREGVEEGFYCDPSNGRCEPGIGCERNTDCASNWCDGGRCLDCLFDSECGQGRTCDEATGACVEGDCASDVECIDQADPCAALQCVFIANRNTCLLASDATPTSCEQGQLYGPCFEDETCSSGLLCVGARCEIACAQGQALCGGACVTLDSDPAHCGGCQRPCGMGEVCLGGQCEQDCGASLTTCGQSCTNTLVDPAHCGECDRVCALPGARPRCQQGTCTTGACQDGLGDCDGEFENGCETPLVEHPLHCGACGAACDAGEVCDAGACRATCSAPLMACAGSCVDTLDDVRHCGGCDAPCAAATRDNVISVCVGGGCDEVCRVGFDDCDGDPVNGCEADLSSDTDCGACDVACTTGQLCNAAAAACECIVGAPEDACALARPNERCAPRADGLGNACECVAGSEASCGLDEACEMLSPAEFVCACTSDAACDGFAVCDQSGGAGVCACGSEGPCGVDALCVDDGLGEPVCECQSDAACAGDETCDLASAPSVCVCGVGPACGGGQLCVSDACECVDDSGCEGDATCATGACVCGDLAMGGSGRACALANETCHDPGQDGDPIDAVCVSNINTTPDALLITEVMTAPPGSRYVEVVNRSGALLDVRGLTYDDGAGPVEVAPQTLVLSPGARLVIVEDTAAFGGAFLPSGAPLLVATMTLERDASTIITLGDDGGGTDASFAYGDPVATTDSEISSADRTLTWHALQMDAAQAQFAAVGGVNPGLNTDDVWCVPTVRDAGFRIGVAQAYGSPGDTNSPCFLTLDALEGMLSDIDRAAHPYLIISEFLSAPDDFEFVEVVNLSGLSIDVQNDGNPLRLVDDTATDVAFDASRLPPGHRLVLADDSDPFSVLSFSARVQDQAHTGDLGIDDDAGTLRLRVLVGGATERDVFAVTYDAQATDTLVTVAPDRDDSNSFMLDQRHLDDALDGVSGQDFAGGFWCVTTAPFAVAGLEGATPQGVGVLDRANPTCEQCAIDGDCASSACGDAGGANPFVCVECEASAGVGCGAEADLCDEDLGACQCTSNVDGAACDPVDVAAQVCDVLDGEGCVQCVASSDCATVGAGDLCDLDPVSPGYKTCVECTAADASACAGSPCDLDPASSTYQTCVACTVVDTSACMGATATCDTNDGSATYHQCVECADDSQCAGNTPLCDLTDHACKGCDVVLDGSLCADDAGEPGAVCDSSSGACVECLTDVDCPGGVCGAAGGATEARCVQCNGDVDCAMGWADTCEVTSGQCQCGGSGATCCGAAPGLCDTDSDAPFCSGGACFACHDADPNDDGCASNPFGARCDDDADGVDDGRCTAVDPVCSQSCP